MSTRDSLGLGGNGTRAGIIAIATVMIAGACGGIVKETDIAPDGGAVSAGGSTGAGATPSSGARPTGSGAKTGQAGSVGKGGFTGAGAAPAATCGNGRIDPGEDCDPTVPLAVTCSSATMGARPAGVVGCTKTCRFDVSKCTNAIGAGGATGTGGVTGTGGGIANSIERCLNTKTIASSDCTQACGCKVCPDVYAACKADGGCAWILSCAHQVGCVSIDDCYQTSCSGIIDTAGGRTSVGARRAEPALACLAQNGCGVACQ